MFSIPEILKHRGRQENLIDLPYDSIAHGYELIETRTPTYKDLEARSDQRGELLCCSLGIIGKAADYDFLPTRVVAPPRRRYSQTRSSRWKYDFSIIHRNHVHSMCTPVELEDAGYVRLALTV